MILQLIDRLDNFRHDFFSVDLTFLYNTGSLSRYLLFIFLFVVFLFLVFMVGASFSGYFQCALYRSHHKIRKNITRSFCDYCGTTLNWIDPVPFINYIILRGRCRHCHAKLPVKYFLAETLSGLIFLLFFVSSRTILITFPLSMLLVFLVSYHFYHARLHWTGTAMYGVLLVAIRYFEGGPDVRSILFSAALILPAGVIFYLTKRDRVDAPSFVFIVLTSLILPFQGVLISVAIAGMVAIAVPIASRFSPQKRALSSSLGNVYFIGFCLSFILYYSFP